MIASKDLTQEAPRSPRERLGPYMLMARMADKGRAVLANTNGEYHFNCPLDQMLFRFKEVDPEAVRDLLKSGATDEQILDWFLKNGVHREPWEIQKWADDLCDYRPYDDTEKRGWFVGECRELGLDPTHTTLFEMLETDDERAFAAR